MRPSKAFLVSVLVGASTFLAPVQAVGDEPEQSTVEPPFFLLDAKIGGRATLRPTVGLTLSSGYVSIPDPAGSEDLSFDIQASRTDMRAARQRPWTNLSSYSPKQSYRPRIRSGQVLCVRVRQHSFGLTSPWSQQQCVVRALDDRRLRSRGRVALVRDRHYADARATVLREGARLLLPGVPRGARFGFVVTRLPDPRYCRVGLFHIASTEPPGGYFGISSGPLVQFNYTRARKTGTAVYLADSAQTCRVGGAIVVPRWMGWQME